LISKDRTNFSFLDIGDFRNFQSFLQAWYFRNSLGCFEAWAICKLHAEVQLAWRSTRSQYVRKACCQYFE